MKELEMDRRVCYPKDEAERDFIFNELKLCKRERLIYSYFRDFG